MKDIDFGCRPDKDLHIPGTGSYCQRKDLSNIECIELKNYIPYNIRDRTSTSSLQSNRKILCI